MILLESKIDPNSGKVTFGELIVHESPEKRGFSDRTVSDNDNFEEIVVLSNHFYNIMLSYWYISTLTPL